MFSHRLFVSHHSKALKSLHMDANLMARISKDPETRRRELIEISEELFLRKGYNETSISDIVKQAQVAQGTFYYYFKTKDEVLDAIAEKYLIETQRIAEQVASRDDLNAVEKMLTISTQFAGVTKDRSKILSQIHEESNALLHLKIEKKAISLLMEPYKAIIQQGIREGVLHTEHPEGAVTALLSIASAILDTPEEISEISGTPMIPGGEVETERMRRNVDTLFDLTERILGARSGIFKEYAKKMKR